MGQYARNKKVDHSAHPHQISAFIVRCLERMLPLVSKGVKISLNGTVYPQFKSLVSICAKRFVSDLIGHYGGPIFSGKANFELFVINLLFSLSRLII